MKKIKFNDYEEFAYTVADKFNKIQKSEDADEFSIVAKYEDTRKIIEHLLYLGYNLTAIEIESPDVDGYEAEYIITLCNIDEDKEIWCEPMLRDNGYINDCSHTTYVVDNCSSKVLEHLLGENTYEVHIFEDKEVVKVDSGKAPVINKPEDSQTSKSVYKVNGEQVDEKTFTATLREIEDEYSSNVRSMLLKYCDVMDRLNDLSKWLL